MKYKFEDLQKVFRQLERHSQKGDISIEFDLRTKSIIFDYVSNLGTDAKITMQVSENNAFVVIAESKWLKD